MEIIYQKSAQKSSGSEVIDKPIKDIISQLDMKLGQFTEEEHDVGLKKKKKKKETYRFRQTTFVTITKTYQLFSALYQTSNFIKSIYLSIYLRLHLHKIFSDETPHHKKHYNFKNQNQIIIWFFIKTFGTYLINEGVFFLFLIKGPYSGGSNI